ncbi:hypothetical protein HOLleu_23861 [Holothuria leucospilota]|uniref:Uncharacterized protein n=1 Tax=Holothuria leucospilota TaxID=206669 RepID=A0A9Q1H5Y1_HOLLE|nr:hypothetical protein HOLleu_23861 [Holothuria leucospilota]
MQDLCPEPRITLHALRCWMLVSSNSFGKQREGTMGWLWKRKMQVRRCSARKWLKPERRIPVGHYHQLMEELLLDDQESFYNFLRVTPPMFD